MDKYIDHSYTEEITCPYCGYELGDSWEFGDDGEEECYKCEKKFEFYRHIEVTYCTYKIEKKENESTKTNNS